MNEHLIASIIVFIATFLFIVGFVSAVQTKLIKDGIIGVILILVSGTLFYNINLISDFLFNLF